MRASSAVALLCALTSCVSVRSYDRLGRETVEGRSWTVAKHVRESRHILAECSSGTGLDVQEIRLLEPAAGRRFALPSDQASASSYWYFIPDDREHSGVHAWRGHATVIAVSDVTLELELDAEALHPDGSRACRRYRGRLEIRPDEAP